MLAHFAPLQLYDMNLNKRVNKFVQSVLCFFFSVLSIQHDTPHLLMFNISQITTDEIQDVTVNFPSEKKFFFFHLDTLSD